MKTIKLMLMMSFIFIGTTIFAQNNQQRTPQERTENQLKGINKACNLTKEQMPKVEKILLNSNTKMEELRTAKPAYKGERMEKMKVISDEQDAQLKAFLTPEQYQKYLTMKEQQKEKAKERRQGQGGTPSF